MRVAILLSVFLLSLFTWGKAASCPIVADIIPKNASCNDLDDGAITVLRIRGGVAPYTVRLYDLSASRTIPISSQIVPDGGSATFSQLRGDVEGRTYYVEIIDNAGCVADRIDIFDQIILKPRQVQVVPSLSRCASCQQPFTVSCANATDGIITVRNPNTGLLGNIPMEFTLLDQNLAVLQVKRLPQDASPLDPTAVSFTGLSGERGPRGKIYYIRTTYTNPTSGVYCDNSSLQALATVNIIEPPALEHDPLFDPVAPVTCNGRRDGLIRIIPRGGTPFPLGAALDPNENYNYLWSNGEVYKPYINNLAAGEYSVTIIDLQGCRKRQTFRVTEPQPLKVQSVQVRNLACDVFNPNLPNGQVIIQVKGGFLGNRNSPAKKRIELFRKDGTGGWNRLWLSGQPAFAEYRVDTVFTFLLGDGGGFISSDQLTPGEYRFEIYEDETNEELRSSFRAAYPGNNPPTEPCFVTGFFNIARPTPLLIKAFPRPLTCNIDLINNLTGAPGPDGQNDPQYHNGRIDVVVSGGTPYVIGGQNRYSYKWYYKPSNAHQNWQELNINSLPLSEPQNRFNLRAGIYRVEVTDANGCSSALEIPLSEPASFSTTVSIIHPKCANSSAGEIHTDVSGGTVPYTYEWSRVVLVNPPITNLENEFLLDSSKSRISGLQANPPGEVYRVKIRDANGCLIQRDSRLIENAPIRISIDAIQHIRCYNTTNPSERGQIKFSVTGGGGTPYYCRLSNGLSTSTPEFPSQNEFTFRQLTAGLYTLTVEDANGCAQSVSFRVNQPPAFSLNIASQNKSCRGGADNGRIKALAKGGTPYVSFPPNYSRYTYNWYKFVNNNFTLQAALTQIDSASQISNLAPGKYRVEVQDSLGCAYFSEPIDITEPSESLSVSIRELRSITCSGASNGVIQALAVGGTPPYQFYWVRSGAPQGSDWLSTQEIGNLRAGSYTFTVRDANGCHNVATYTLLEPAPILIQNITATAANNCQANGSISFNVTAPSSLGPLVALLSPRPQTPGFSSPQPFTGNAVNLRFEGLPAGNYNIIVRNGAECEASAVANVFEGFGITNLDIVTDSVSCAEKNNGKITVRAIIGGIGSHLESYSYAIRSVNAGNIFMNNTPANNNMFTGLAAGAYDVRVSYTHTNGAICSYVKRVNIGEPAPLAINVERITDVACFNQRNGAISINVTGGNGGNRYAWSNGASTQNIDNLSPGSYFLTVTDRKGCSATVNNLIVRRPAEPLTASLDNTVKAPYNYLPVSACRENDGRLITIIAGGWKPYTIRWSNGVEKNNVLTDTLAGLAQGRYSYTVIDARGCEAISNAVTITKASALEIATIQVNPSATCGSTTGIIQFNVNGGTHPIEYRLHDSRGRVLRSGLVNPSNPTVLREVLGNNSQNPNYILTISDFRECTDTILVNVPNPALPVVQVNNVRDVTCFGANNGSAIATATVNQQNCPNCIFTWILNGQVVASRPDPSNLAAGRYQVVATNPATNCSSAPVFVVIRQPGAFTASAANLSTTNVRCNGESNGTAGVLLEEGAGTPPYVYTWRRNGAILQRGDFPAISGLAAGNYSLTIEDANNCPPIVLNFEIREFNRIAYNIDTTRSRLFLRCNGSSEGIIALNIIGGNPPYNNRVWTKLGDSAFDPRNFNLVNTPTSSSISNLTAGQYRFSITDASGCSYFETIPVNQPAAIQIQSQVLNVGCSGLSTGSATFTIRGGTRPYTYTLPGFATGSSPTGDNILIANLNAGVYNFTVTDANGCFAVHNFVVQRQISDIQVSNACFGELNGKITLTTQNGAPPYRYEWSGTQSGAFVDNSLRSVYTIQPLLPGAYNVRIIDSRSCTTSFTNIIISVASSALKINSVRVLRDSGKQTDISCRNGSDGKARVEFEGGEGPYTIIWSTSSDTILRFPFTVVDGRNLRVGPGEVNTVTVIDKNGCVAMSNFTLTQPERELVINALVQPPSQCSQQARDGRITLNIQGGIPPYAVQWFDGSTALIRENIAEGSYRVSVTDANGCQVTRIIEVRVERPTIILDPRSRLNLTCKGDSDGFIDVNVTGGAPPYQYIWRKNGTIIATSEDISNLSAGTYVLTVSDARNCLITAEFTVTEPSANINITQSVRSSDCGANNGFIILRLNEGNNTSIAWTSPNGYANVINGNDGTITGLAFGTYTARITTFINNLPTCTRISFFVDLNTSLRIASKNVKPISCANRSDGRIELTVTGGIPPYTFSWLDNGVFNPAQTDRLRLDLSSGNYIFRVTDSSNPACFRLDTTLLTAPSPIVATVVSRKDVSCNGGRDGAVTITVSGGRAPYSFLWKDQANFEYTTQDLSEIRAGVYSCIITDASGCQANINVTIAQPLQPLSVNKKITDAKCNDQFSGSVELTVTGGTAPYTYLWSNGKTTKDILAVSPGSYTVTITDSRGCTLRDTVVVRFERLPAPRLEVSNTNICAGASITLAAIGSYPSGVQYFWSDGAVTNTAVHSYKPVRTQFVKVTVRIAACNLSLDSDSILVRVNPVPPAPTFTIEGNTLTCDSIADSYRWFRETQQEPVLVGETRSITTTIAGRYFVEIMRNGCSNRSQSREFTPVSREKDKIGFVACYPNPTSAIVRVQLENVSASHLSFRVFGPLGQEILLGREAYSNQKGLELDLSQLSSGIYTIHLEANGNTYVAKVIKN
jgi:hypothetical protein